MTHKKKILFLHHNFPGQFKSLSTHCAEKGHDVVFLTEKNHIGSISGIKHRIVNTENSKLSPSFQGQLQCAERFQKALQELKDENWIPDVVISHTGWGCGLDAILIFPSAKRIAYFEWWFQDQSDNYTFDPKNEWIKYPDELRLLMRRRNLTLAQEMAEADYIVTPTNWQKGQLPNTFKTNTTIIHEGVNTSYFVPNESWKPKDKLRVTYATRGMEPMRGFPEFIGGIKQVLRQYEQVEVIVAGDDRVVYGSNKPPQGSFGRWAQCELNQFIKNKRVIFTGHLALKKYARLLKSSHLHCYFTRPFVASWSIQEAMSSGCCILANKIPVTEEILSQSHTIWTDHTNSNELVGALTRGIELSASDRLRMGNQQRLIAVQHWEVRDSLKKWKGLLGI